MASGNTGGKLKIFGDSNSGSRSTRESQQQQQQQQETEISDDEEGGELLKVFSHEKTCFLHMQKQRRRSAAQ